MAPKKKQKSKIFHKKKRTNKKLAKNTPHIQKKTKRQLERDHYSFVPGQGTTKSCTTDHLKTFTCRIHGIPKPQDRCYASTQGTRKVQIVNRSKYITQSFTAAFKQALLSAQASCLFSFEPRTPMRVKILFYFSRPKAHFVFKNNTNKLISNPPIYVTTNPDVDNCAKLVLDALQGVCYDVDKVVSHIECVKLYDPMQTQYQKKCDSQGWTIVKVTKINESVFQNNCDCFSCKSHQKNHA